MCVNFTERFRTYFEREAAQTAAKSLSDGAEIEFQILNGTLAAETFTLTREQHQNQVKNGPARQPQLVFTLPHQAAEEILAEKSQEIGKIGVNIMQLIITKDTNLKIGVQFRAGFLTLFSKGYLGIISTGGSVFAAFMASQRLNGIGAIKAALKRAIK